MPAERPRVAQQRRETAPVDATAAPPLDTSVLDAAVLDAEREFNEPPEDIHEVELEEIEQPDAREEAMVNAARGIPVAPDVVDFIQDDGALVPARQRRFRPTWDGRPTRFTLAHPVLRNQGELAMEDDQVTYKVTALRDADGNLNGEFVGDGGPFDESGTVKSLYDLGYFKYTDPWREREATQAAVDFERGVFQRHVVGETEDGKPIIQEPMRSLAQPTGPQVKELLQRTRGIASPAAMKAAERIAAGAGSEAPGTRAKPIGTGA